jgi:hypothetical protein
LALECERQGWPGPTFFAKDRRKAKNIDTIKIYTHNVCMQDRIAKSKRSMVRKQVFITVDQNRQLKVRARATGQAEADIVRKGIDLALTADAAESEDWREGLRRALALGVLDEQFAERVRENKRVQSQAWRKRLERTRRLLAGD